MGQFCCQNYFIGLLDVILRHVPAGKWPHGTTMAQMAHFSFPYYFTIPNSEFRIPKFALRISEFEIVKYM